MKRKPINRQGCLSTLHLTEDYYLEYMINQMTDNKYINNPNNKESKKCNSNKNDPFKTTNIYKNGPFKITNIYFKI